MINPHTHIILASGSPRRKELLAGLGLPFEVKLLPGIDESYPESMPAHQVPAFLAEQKQEPYKALLGDEHTVVITADTVVICEGRIFGKPKDLDEARQMLHALSGRSHDVTTGVCLAKGGRRRTFSVTTQVTFKELTDEEINYYVDTYRPLDKAGAYGIQEWIGYTGCTGLVGSYYNVMGLPVQRIYEELQLL